MMFNADNALLLVADTWELLRPSDIWRLFETHYALREQLMGHLIKHRPDLQRRADGDLAAITDEMDAFALANDPTPHRPAQFENAEQRRQRVCVEGMGLLPGQLDLF